MNQTFSIQSVNHLCAVQIIEDYNLSLIHI